MKSTLAVIGIAITIFGTLWIKEDMASSIIKAPAHPLEQVFEQYKTTERFEIPENHGATEEEKKKWALLRDVIACESASRWVIVEVPGVGWDVGPCMINTFHHIVPAARMGLDLMVPSENMRYCLYLYEQFYPVMEYGNGWNPWVATQECWKDRQAIRKMQARR